MAAAVTGAIVGAGVAVAGAVVLSDKRNRDKIDEAVNDVKEKASETKANVEEKLAEVKDKGVKLENSLKDSVKSGVADARDALTD